MKKIALVLVILCGWFNAKAQNPVVVTQPYKFMKYVNIKDSLRTQIRMDIGSVHNPAVSIMPGAINLINIDASMYQGLSGRAIGFFKHGDTTQKAFNIFVQDTITVIYGLNHMKIFNAVKLSTVDSVYGKATNGEFALVPFSGGSGATTIYNGNGTINDGSGGRIVTITANNLIWSLDSLSKMTFSGTDHHSNTLSATQSPNIFNWGYSNTGGQSAQITMIPYTSLGQQNNINLQVVTASNTSSFNFNGYNPTFHNSITGHGVRYTSYRDYINADSLTILPKQANDLLYAPSTGAGYLPLGFTTNQTVNGTNSAQLTFNETSTSGHKFNQIGLHPTNTTANLLISAGDNTGNSTGLVMNENGWAQSFTNNSNTLTASIGASTSGIEAINQFTHAGIQYSSTTDYDEYTGLTLITKLTGDSIAKAKGDSIYNGKVSGHYLPLTFTAPQSITASGNQLSMNGTNGNYQWNWQSFTDGTKGKVFIEAQNIVGGIGHLSLSTINLTDTQAIFSYGISGGSPVGVSEIIANVNGIFVLDQLAKHGLTAANNTYVPTDSSYVTKHQTDSLYRSSKWVIGEVPSGTINGSNVTFTLAHTPTSNTAVYQNGFRLIFGTDYTLSGSTLTWAVAPLSVNAFGVPDTIQVDYISP